MATIYKTKPTKDPDVVMIKFVRSKLSTGYAAILTDTLNDMRSQYDIDHNIHYNMVDINTTYTEFNAALNLSKPCQ